MTWGEIKLATLGKLEADDREPNGEYAPILIPAANEAIALLETMCGAKVMQLEIEMQADVPRDLKDFVPRFYEIVTVLKCDGAKRFETLDFATDDGSVLRMFFDGIFVINHTVRCEQITGATADEQEIELEREAAAIIPLYIASQIYKHDNAQLSTVWRNEFEAARQELARKYHEKPKGRIEF